MGCDAYRSGELQGEELTLLDLLPKNNEGGEWTSAFYHDDVFQYLTCVKTWYPTGSYYICDPQVVTTDKDFFVLVEGGFEAAVRQLEAAGYTYSQADQEEYDLQGEDVFRCFRKGSINLIVMLEQDMYDRWLDATELAKNMKLNEKEQRIRLFQYVLYGNTTLKGEED